MLAGLGEGERRVDPADPAADDQHVRVDRRAAPVQLARAAATRRTAPAMSAFAFSVASPLSAVTQLTCSRMLAIWE